MRVLLTNFFQGVDGNQSQINLAEGKGEQRVSIFWDLDKIRICIGKGTMLKEQRLDAGVAARPHGGQGKPMTVGWCVGCRAVLSGEQEFGVGVFPIALGSEKGDHLQASALFIEIPAGDKGKCRLTFAELCVQIRDLGDRLKVDGKTVGSEKKFNFLFEAAKVVLGGIRVVEEKIRRTGKA